MGQGHHQRQLTILGLRFTIAMVVYIKVREFIKEILDLLNK